VDLIYMFRALGGMDFKPQRTHRIVEPRALETMGRRAGRFRDMAPATASFSNEYDEPPLVILILELFPWLCRVMMPLLLAYATIFFAVPASRALYIAVQNHRIKRRNEIRKVKAQETFVLCVQETEKQGRARGKQTLEVIA
jgi:hypothetical protein